MRRLRQLVVAALLSLSSGCYAYHETELESVTPGTPIRIRLSPEEAARLAELRLTDARLVDGTLIANGGDRVMLDTRVGVNDPTRGSRALVQRVAVPVTEVHEVELRRLDWLKTGAIAGAFALGVGIVAAAALDGDQGDEGPGGGDIPESRAPWRFPLRLRLPAF